MELWMIDTVVRVFNMTKEEVLALLGNLCCICFMALILLSN